VFEEYGKGEAGFEAALSSPRAASGRDPGIRGVFDTTDSGARRDAGDSNRGKSAAVGRFDARARGRDRSFASRG
jgi:hypothetical protein